jgi:hypothetical protein
MKVTPVSRKFGKYAPGDEFELPERTAKLLIKVGKLQEVTSSAPVYQTRMMTAEPPTQKSDDAPYGYKLDGTPRARPGRQAKAE